MNNCRVTLIPLEDKKEYQPGFSLQGIKYLSGSANVQLQLPFTRREFVTVQPKKQRGMSISGYQPKLSLRIVNDQFTVVDTFGTYILKPSPEEYPNLAENEHAIMSVMKKLGFDVPPFGLVPFQQATDSDNLEYAFLIKRFDRNKEDQSKVHQEQLDGAMGIEEKYGKVNGVQTISYERVCQFLIENIDSNLQFKRELFKRIMYSYLLGNNDLHLRNFSIIMPTSMLLFTTIGSVIWLGDKLTLGRIIGIGFIISGVLFVGGNSLVNLSMQDTLIGDLMFLGCGFLWAIYTLLAKYWKINPWDATILVSMVSACLYLPFYIYNYGTQVFDVASDTLLIQGLYQGLFASIGALYLYSKAVSILGAAKGAIFSVLLPPLSLLLASFLLDEGLTWVELVGLLIVCVGMLFAFEIFRFPRRIANSQTLTPNQDN